MENKNSVLLYHFLDHNNIPFYVGITNNFKRRFNEHLAVLKKGKNGKTWPVYNKIRKLINENDYILNMQIIKNNLTVEEAFCLEKETIAKYKNEGIKLYNITLGGEGAYGHKPVFTEEWKKKLSEAKSGDKFTGNKNSFYGKHHSNSTKEKLSKLKKGKQIGKENPFYGKKHSEESLKIIAVTAHNTFFGKSKSDEQKLKMSQSAMGRKNSAEHNEKNRLKSCIPYKVTIIKNNETFIWYRGSVELSKFILEKYKIKINPGTITASVREKRPTKHLLITRFQPGI